MQLSDTRGSSLSRDQIKFLSAHVDDSPNGVKSWRWVFQGGTLIATRASGNKVSIRADEYNDLENRGLMQAIESPRRYAITSLGIEALNYTVIWA